MWEMMHRNGAADKQGVIEYAARMKQRKIAALEAKKGQEEVGV
jgi:hypothetical protein